MRKLCKHVVVHRPLFCSFEDKSFHRRKLMCLFCHILSIPYNLLILNIFTNDVSIRSMVKTSKPHLDKQQATNLTQVHIAVLRTQGFS